jgi:hypothetical protein
VTRRCQAARSAPCRREQRSRLTQVARTWTSTSSAPSMSWAHQAMLSGRRHETHETRHGAQEHHHVDRIVEGPTRVCPGVERQRQAGTPSFNKLGQSVRSLSGPSLTALASSGDGDCVMDAPSTEPGWCGAVRTGLVAT